MSQVLLTFFLLSMGLVLLTLGADWLVRGAATLAQRLRVGPLLIGLTIVAFGTSAPELFATSASVLKGHGDLALGNVVGSNIMNIGLILGVSAWIYPVRVGLDLFRWDIPLVTVISLLFPLLLLDGRMSRWEGGILFAGIMGYVLVTAHRARLERNQDVVKEFVESLPKVEGSYFHDFLWIVVGLVSLTLGSHWLVQGAIGIARFLGASEGFIGLTIVAFGTSVPELATCIVASVRKEGDILIGNIVGSNIFNILAILGLTSLLFPFEFPGFHMDDVWVMIFFSLLLVPMLWTGKILSRWEGFLLLGAYALYVFLLTAFRMSSPASL